MTSRVAWFCLLESRYWVYCSELLQLCYCYLNRSIVSVSLASPDNPIWHKTTSLRENSCTVYRSLKIKGLFITQRFNKPQIFDSQWSRFTPYYWSRIIALQKNMEVDVGEHCSFSSCNRLGIQIWWFFFSHLYFLPVTDFLPFVCDLCQRTFWWVIYHVPIPTRSTLTLSAQQRSLRPFLAQLWACSR